MTAATRQAAQDALEQQAGEWLLRIGGSEPDAETLGEWLTWYCAEPAHREAFDRLQHDYEQLRSLPTLQRRQLAAALMSDVPARPRRTARRRGWRAVTAAAAMLVAGVAVWALAPDWRPDPLAETGHWRTARSEHQRLALPDGSVVTLGADTHVVYRYRHDERRIVLARGEAYFEVASDPARPFVADAGTTTVRALGTAFNVRRTGARVAVTVSEGEVAVRRDEARNVLMRLAAPFTVRPDPLHVTAGQGLVVDPQAVAAPRPRPVSAELATAWQQGRLEFFDEPLQAVIATIGRYHEHDIVIAAPGLHDMTLTASVMDDHIDEWLDSLPGIMPLRINRLDGRVLILPR